MIQIETNQITFGKATKIMIAKTVKNAKTFKAVGKDYLIKDAAGNIVATWHKRSLKNGLLIVR